MVLVVWYGILIPREEYHSYEMVCNGNTKLKGILEPTDLSVFLVFTCPNLAPFLFEAIGKFAATLYSVGIVIMKILFSRNELRRVQIVFHKFVKSLLIGIDPQSNLSCL